MFWWVLLGYVLLSPVLGLLVGTAIRMQDACRRSSRSVRSLAVDPCAPSTAVRVGGGMKVAAGR